ncbi:MAG TPA: protein kinase [Polyangiaceae bacterium]
MQPVLVSNRFEILRRLGEGGMGVVYEANDRERGERVALKTLLNASAEHLARLKREFRAMQDVHHPSLVALRELVREDDRWFLTMELVQGVDFVSYVRPAPFTFPVLVQPSQTAVLGSSPTIPVARAASVDEAMFDEARLRDAARKLAEGLLALHQAGMVHRDVKPSNVLVTREGRVAILDFGLVASLRDEASAIVAAGTPAYMAPEQVVSGDVGPEADWYAVGALLYEVLTGRVPFDGAPLQMMMRKQSETPLAPSALRPDVPADLDELCMALLRFAPAERPRGSAVLQRLGGAARQASGSISRTLSPQFVGRARELELLSTCLRESRSGGAAVLIDGESGVGKSQLVRRFAERLSLEDPSAVVLTGRCYERETIPYKAFDGAIDALGRLLAHMTEAEARGLLPTRPAPLVQVFPVLRRVPAIADSLRTLPRTLDPIELRTRAFGALRELLTRLGDRRPVVLVIDDAQWADRDSLGLLAEITRLPDAPQVLLVATVRRSAEGDTKVSHEAGALANLVNAISLRSRCISLGPLSPEESHELAKQLVERSGAPQGVDVEAIAAEAGGHPLFLDVLARHAAGGAPGAKKLGDALRAELATLDGDANSIVETVAIACAPLTHQVVERATALPRDLFVRAVQRLRIGRLIVSTGVRGADRIEPYHDRVRAAVFARIGSDRRAEVHRNVARALASDPNADPEWLAVHWREAGDHEQAAHYSALAGDRAVQTLAFDRAASFFEQALAPGAPATLERRKLLVKLGGALANAGRGAAAARTFVSAAEGAPAAEALDLRRHAADQLLSSGQFDEGLDMLRAVLASIGMALPKSPRRALVFLFFARLWLRLRGLRFTPRDATEVAATDLTRIDTCWTVAYGLAMIDNIRGAAFQARLLSLALATGEKQRIARALALEIGYVSRYGLKTEGRVAKLVERTTRLAAETSQPEIVGMTYLATALAQHMHGRFRRGLDAADQADAIFRDCNGVARERANAWMLALYELHFLGLLRELARRHVVYLRDAEDRGDVYAQVHLRVGHPTIRWLAADDPEQAREDVSEAMDMWSKQNFQSEHYYELIALSNVDLYAGEPARAHERMVRRWPDLRGSLLLLVQAVRIVGKYTRGRAAVALGEQSGERSLFGEAARDARSILGERTAWGAGLGALVRAGVEASRGEDARSVSSLRRAIASLEASEMALHAAAARRSLGIVVGGDEGRSLVRAADEWMASEGIKNPGRMTGMLAPGFARFAKAKEGESVR